MNNPQAGTQPLARAWQARLDLTLERRAGRTVLGHCRHSGPLRVQRPFYPAAPGECHLYLLHPPGGMVTGDSLDISIKVEAGAHGLLTTPSAGKIYRGDRSDTGQHQRLHCVVSKEAILEWLPQETIVFDGARGEGAVKIDLQEGARFCAWDIVCLGRPASGERFTSGYFRQDLQVFRNAVPLYIERNRFQGGSLLLESPWGLHGQPVAGTLVAGVDLTGQQLDAYRQQLMAAATGDLVALSAFDGLVVCRYLGASTAKCRDLFTHLWQDLRPELAGIPATIPRIWHT